MTYKERLIELDKIREQFGISIDNVALVTKEDMLHDITHLYTPLQTAKEMAKMKNCLNQMFRVIYNIKEVSDDEETRSLVEEIQTLFHADTVFIERVSTNEYAPNMIRADYSISVFGGDVIKGEIND